MVVTDEFSRWQEANSNEKMYHVQSHQWALSWATSQLRDVQPEDIPTKIEDIKSILKRVKDGLHADQSSDESLPFHFRRDELILDNFVPPESINNVFESVYEPEPYLDAIYDVQAIAQTGVRTVAFTYGEPDFQFEKLLRLRDRLAVSGKGWPYEYIFLTKIPKGEFVEKLLETSHQDTRLRDDLFSTASHVFMLVDDDKKQTNDFLRAQQMIENETGARLSVVHSLRERTKNWKRRDVVYRDVPGMGRVIDENQRQGIHIHGEIEDVASEMSTDVQSAHRDAVSNLQLRVYNQLASNTRDQVGLEPQCDFFSQTAYNIERDIESRHGIPMMTL